VQLRPQQSYELLNLSWFDDAYLDQWGENESGQWALLKRGLHHSLMARLTAYIRDHRHEFIRP
jgi:hypothetical protein